MTVWTSDVVWLILDAYQCSFLLEGMRSPGEYLFEDIFRSLHAVAFWGYSIFEPYF